MSDNSQVGKIGWIDMTVDDADYSMTLPGSGEAVTGICHARGGNSELPGATAALYQP